MREIKFRGKCIDNGDWIYGCLGIFSDGAHQITISSERKISRVFDGKPFYTIHSQCQEVDPATIGQYTGLKDYNSKEVYEGDIIKVEDWGVEFYVVEYFGERDYPAFDLVPDVVDDCNGLSHLMAMTRFEVVGNRWDNPELLGAAHD